jgi:hypothetical protein
MSTVTARLQPNDLLSKLPGPNGERFVSGFRHGTLELELYAPRGHDQQSPHRRDEVYAVWVLFYGPDGGEEPA